MCVVCVCVLCCVLCVVCCVLGSVLFLWCAVCCVLCVVCCVLCVVCCVLLLFHFCSFFDLFHFSPFFTLAFLVIFFLFFVFCLRFFSFFDIFKGDLHSGRSKVTRVTVGRDTNQSFRVCIVNLATPEVVKKSCDPKGRNNSTFVPLSTLVWLLILLFVSLSLF